MSTLLKDMPFATAFVDDIVIFSKTMDEHIPHVEAVIKALTNVNLVLNPDKCHFAQKSVYLLGFCVSADGRTLDHRKVTNVLEWPVPKSIKEVQSFLGVVNYFQQHIPNRSLLMAPLSALTTKKVLKPSDWTPLCQTRFDQLKELLTKVPTLGHPDLRYPFAVATDASDVGIGAALFQVIDGKKRYIAFMARSLNKHQRRYNIFKRLLLVVFALQKFHKYLWGSKFQLFTDHQALVYLHSQKLANDMMARWMATLIDYNFEVVHIPGADNTLPDHMSRLYPEGPRLEGGNLDIIGTIPGVTQQSPMGKQLDKKKKHAIRRTLRSQSKNQSMELPMHLDTKQPTPLTGLLTQDYIPDMWTPPPNERQKILDEHHLLGHYVRRCFNCQMFNVSRSGFHPLEINRSKASW
ncbi:hypothetical protein O0I10_008711 [Lichtheimia ornata]|uniref:Reverse transcriptase domain-containing protein n=1 Tax=Lichtheimia ornata TaxID=688661 RepID=A0AAD7UXT6_9FUNG|nr:uncharacterized protein O0I10_008711 [Lichtheimia ornata]KAJ8655623.1 hypothetical protein O0I10_008711 [Lichtheimia ornata]